MYIVPVWVTSWQTLESTLDVSIKIKAQLNSFLFVLEKYKTGSVIGSHSLGFFGVPVSKTSNISADVVSSE